MNKDEKLKKVKEIMKDINKQQKETVLDFASSQKSWDRLSTGVESLDKFIGDGFPYGHLSIVWGSAGCGKSSLMYSTIAQAQKKGNIVAFLDVENSFEPTRATMFGVNCNELIIGHYKVAEQALDTIINLAREKAVDVIILDSIHSMAPKGEVEDKKGSKSVESDTMALLARKLAQFFRMASTFIYKANIALIMVGQTRTDLGGFIALQKLSGGNALIHNSVLTIHMRKGQKSNNPQISTKVAFIDPDKKVHVHTEKNDAGFSIVLKLDKKQCDGGQNEGATVEIPYYYNTGFSILSEENIPIRIEAENEDDKKLIEDYLSKKFVKEACKILEKDEKALTKLAEIYTDKKPKKKRGRPRKEKKDESK